ncbi:MAG: universal stress protein [Mixta calida]|jgi:nucleotide-binding universal stress UspA family protein|uniref:universal stress protein n=2 Tax=Erwiniaceae TaxID=1903409 RepID=UPI0006610BBE|nr:MULTISPECIES: universal stress protein [Pantoea]MDU2734358.1 universal stress protein [Mixta calida]MBS6438643.1 universal stress protein [Pantoea sp.]MDU1575819.1 universal stress protein [Pantoea sp.]MDU2728248.1 universal stress protein [Pantoea sp.]MDU5471896.1 universal stress protein [Pantoea sp.]
MKTLLMAVDNSPVAQKVIATAIEEALAHKAQVVVLCCVDPAYSSCNQPVYIAAGEDPEDFAAAQDEQNTAELVVRHALAPLLRAGVDARGLIVAGEAADTIVAQSHQLNAQMIIMGRRHLSSFNRLLKGSVSAAVIERAHCPVLIDVRKD